MGQQQADDDILDVDQAAAWLRVHPQTIRDMLKEGRLPGQKVGREWRMSRAAIRTWLSLRAGQPATDTTITDNESLQ